MGQTILRVLDGTELSAELSSKLKELLPEFTVERYKEKPDYKRSIKRRIDSLHAAFLFILDAYPLDPKFTRITKENLTLHANNAVRTCDLSSENFKDLQGELEKFTGTLINALRAGWQWASDPLSSSIACLNEAEQYVLMREGRPDIATLTPMDFGDGPEYLLQWDESLPPYSEQWLAELRIIKANDSYVAPEWFRGLSEHEHAYLANLSASRVDVGAVTAEQLIADVQALLEDLETEKRVTPSSAWTLNLQNIHEQKAPFPDWYNKLSKAKQEMVRVLSAPSTCATLETSIQKFKTFLVSKKTNEAFTAELRTSISMPLWYTLLSHHQQLFLTHVLKNAARVEDVVSFLPSRHRTLPAPANFGRHSILRVNKDEIIPLSDKRYRSSHISSRDVIPLKSGLPQAIQQLHCDSNLMHVMRYATSQQKMLLQTLISPLDFIPDAMSSVFPDHIPPDYALFHQARASVVHSEYGPRVFQHNHPYNYAKIYYYTTAKDPDSLRLIAQTKEAIAAIEALQKKIEKLKKDSAALSLKVTDSPGADAKEQKLLGEQIKVLQEELRVAEGQLPKFSAQKDDLKELVEEYSKTLNSSFGSATIFDYNGRELFLSSLEQLIILTQAGYSYGSCVSGKDRKAVELIHTDAMIIYKQIYGHWPSLNHASASEERVNFVALVAKLYLSRHQHELAGQNAPGSEGIKTPAVYLPKDICDEITRQLGIAEGLKQDDRLATDNEVKNIFSSGSLKKCLVCELELGVSLVLGEAMCTQIYDSLVALLNQKHLFKPIKSGFFVPEVPGGIGKIKEIMKDVSSGNTNTERLARIMAVVNARPSEEESRTEATRKVYEGIKGLCNVSLKPDVLIKMATTLKAEWDTLYSISKAHVSTAKKSKEDSSSDEEAPSPVSESCSM